MDTTATATTPSAMVEDTLSSSRAVGRKSSYNSKLNDHSMTATAATAISAAAATKQRVSNASSALQVQQQPPRREEFWSIVPEPPLPPSPRRGKRQHPLLETSLSFHEVQNEQPQQREHPLVLSTFSSQSTRDSPRGTKPKKKAKATAAQRKQLSPKKKKLAAVRRSSKLSQTTAAAGAMSIATTDRVTKPTARELLRNERSTESSPPVDHLTSSKKTTAIESLRSLRNHTKEGSQSKKPESEHVRGKTISRAKAASVILPDGNSKLENSTTRETSSHEQQGRSSPSKDSKEPLLKQQSSPKKADSASQKKKHGQKPSQASMVTAVVADNKRKSVRKTPIADDGGEKTLLGLSNKGNDQIPASGISSRRLRRNSAQYRIATKTSNRGDFKAPPTANVEDGDQKLPAKTHNTRLKNGIQKQKTKNVVSPEELLEHDTERELLIDRCANLLATVDNRGHQRALLQDANAVLEDIILPMSCPWTHACEPVVRTIPRDVDDLCRTFELEACESDEERDVAGLDSDRLCPTAQHSSDPGVIELTSFRPKPPPPARKSPRVRKSSRSRVRGTPSEDIPGELFLRLYEETQQRKRQGQETSITTKSTALVSVRFAGISSRADIFDNVPKGRSALLLDAFLPQEVVEGRHVNVSNAPRIAGPLGTYDSRYGLLPADEKPIEDGQRAPRTHAGRTRLFWTTTETVKDSPSKQIRRGFRSLITGKKMKNGSHKRPRSVQVGVRINGEVLCVKKSRYDSFLKKASSEAGASTRSNLPYTSGLVEEALEHACGSTVK